MAQNIQVLLIDDIDGGEAHETIAFGLDGADYEIDLSTANASEMREKLAQFVGSAREIHPLRVIRGGRGRPALTRRDRTVDTKAIRDWAKHNGYEVSERGRIPADILAKYNALPPMARHVPMQPTPSPVESVPDVVPDGVMPDVVFAAAPEHVHTFEDGACIVLGCTAVPPVIETTPAPELPPTEPTESPTPTRRRRRSTQPE